MNKKSAQSEKEPSRKQKTIADASAIEPPDLSEALSPEAMLRINRNLQRSQAEIAEELWDMKGKFLALFELERFSVVYQEMIYDSAGQIADARFIDANSAYIAMVGTDPRGKTISEVFPELKADAVCWMESYANRDVGYETVRFEHRWPMNGFWFDCIARQYKPGHFIVAFLDITSRKLAEEKCRKSEEKYRLLVDNTHDIIYTLNTDGVFTFISPAATTCLGYMVEEMLGQSYHAFVHPEDLPLFSAWFKTVIESEGPWPGVEYRARHVDGTWRWLISSAVPFKNKTGTVIGYNGIATDITERKIVEEKLRSSQARYQALLEQSVVALVLVNIQTQEVVEVNQLFTEMLGYSLPEDSPLYISDFLIESKAKRDRRYTVTLKQQRVLPAGPLLLRHKNGMKIPVERAGRVIKIDGQDYLLASYRDMTVEHRHQKEIQETMEALRNKQDLLEKTNALLVESQEILQHQATHDSLTGLLNRPAVLEVLAKELARHKRFGDGLAIGMCDIDHFKKINDTFGHLVGDDVLRWFAKTMIACVREYDVVARIGGEEFLLILPLKSGSDAKPVFERCCSQIAHKKMHTIDGEIGITVSIGVAYAAADSLLDKLLSEADTALYQAKAQGRNRVVYSNPSKTK